MNAQTIDCRLVVDGPAAGDWNMAVDEALVSGAAETGGFCCRLYQWSEPTLSLGYFQPIAERVLHAASRDCPLVRRTSGGGAILHDRELTYSLAVPGGHALARSAEDLYLAVHAALVEALGRLGVVAGMNRTASKLAPDREPFLCFQRRAAGDLLVGHAKIAGSAQRRRRGAVLQHGSILLETSHQAPELPGIDRLTGIRLTPVDLGRAWLPSLERRFGWRFHEQPLTEGELGAVQRLVAEKFGQRAWTERR